MSEAQIVGATGAGTRSVSPARAASAFIAYLAGVFGGAALLAYPVYELLGLLGVASPSFSRIVFRLAELLAVVGMWPLLAAVGTGGRGAWGLPLPGRRPGQRFARDVAAGIVIGAGMLAVLAGVLVLAGVRIVSLEGADPLALVAEALLKGIVTGLVVAFIEELWLRGALQSFVARVLGHGAGIGLVAAIYAALHFIRPDFEVAPDAVGWSSGWLVLTHLFDRLSSPAIIDSALALAAAGVLLGLVRWRRRDIAACIGIHAGWVAVIKLVKETTRVDPDAALASLVGGYDGILGWGAVLWFSLLAAGYVWLSGPAARRL